MRKLFRCKKCGYNFLAIVADPPAEKTEPPKEIKCPKCGAPQN